MYQGKNGFLIYDKKAQDDKNGQIHKNIKFLYDKRHHMLKVKCLKKMLTYITNDIHLEYITLFRKKHKREIGRDVDRKFTKQEPQLANKYMKTSSISLAIKTVKAKQRRGDISCYQKWQKIKMSDNIKYW